MVCILVGLCLIELWFGDLLLFGGVISGVVCGGCLVRYGCRSLVLGGISLFTVGFRFGCFWYLA